MIEKSIVGISVGVLYRRTFRISAISGDAIETILFSPNSPFPEGFFEKISRSADNLDITVSDNVDRDNYIRINTDNFIAGIKGEYPEVMTKAKDLTNFIMENFFKKFNIGNIRRIGVIFHHKIPNTIKFDKIVPQLSNNSVNAVDEVQCRFSQKFGDALGMEKKGVDNYKNAIYTFSRIEEDLYFNFDYQHYFKPALADVRDSGIDKFISEADDYLKKKVYPWLKNYEQ